jgi:hypothetical protein
VIDAEDTDHDVPPAPSVPPRCSPN